MIDWEGRGRSGSLTDAQNNPITHKYHTLTVPRTVEFTSTTRFSVLCASSWRAKEGTPVVEDTGGLPLRRRKASLEALGLRGIARSRVSLRSKRIGQLHPTGNTHLTVTFRPFHRPFANFSLLLAFGWWIPRTNTSSCIALARASLRRFDGNQDKWLCNPRL
ncbi:hypothetical protein PM082_000110 [Marasmius tenuissimus]|nr:hypothetical protein PM082_000110 [Marasmius tenuissimus]